MKSMDLGFSDHLRRIRCMRKGFDALHAYRTCSTEQKKKYFPSRSRLTKFLRGFGVGRGLIHTVPRHTALNPDDVKLNSFIRLN